MVAELVVEVEVEADRNAVEVSEIEDLEVGAVKAQNPEIAEIKGAEVAQNGVEVENEVKADKCAVEAEGVVEVE